RAMDAAIAAHCSIDPGAAGGVGARGAAGAPPGVWGCPPSRPVPALGAGGGAGAGEGGRGGGLGGSGGGGATYITARGGRGAAGGGGGGTGSASASTGACDIVTTTGPSVCGPLSRMRRPRHVSVHTARSVSMHIVSQTKGRGSGARPGRSTTASGTATTR